MSNPANKVKSPGLVALLRNAVDEGRLTRQDVADAADMSYTSARRILECGWPDFDQMQRMIGELPPDIAMAVAAELCKRSADFGVTAIAGQGCGTPPLKIAVEANSKLAEAVHKTLVYCADNCITSLEGADLLQVLAGVELLSGRLRAEVQRRTGRSQTA